MKIDVMVTGPLLHYGIHPNLIYKMLEFAKATDGEVSLIELNDGHPTKLLELTINDAMPPVRERELTQLLREASEEWSMDDLGLLPDSLCEHQAKRMLAAGWRRK